MTTDERGTGRQRDGARHLANLVLVLGALAALAGPVLAVYQLTQPGGSVAVVISENELLADPTPDGLPEGTRLAFADTEPDVVLEVDELPAGLRLLTRLDDLVAAGLLLTGAVLLRAVLRDIGRGQPFHPRMEHRLGALAVVVVGAAILPGLASTLATVVVLNRIDGLADGSPLGFTIMELELLPLVVAGALVALSRVFRHGRQLTEDTEGLV